LGGFGRKKSCRKRKEGEDSFYLWKGGYKPGVPFLIKGPRNAQGSEKIRSNEEPSLWGGRGFLKEIKKKRRKGMGSEGEEKKMSNLCLRRRGLLKSLQGILRGEGHGTR